MASHPPPNPTDILRYHLAHGANLGSVFVQERWLTGTSLFPASCNGSSELACMTACLIEFGLEKTREKFEKHWREWVSDEDLDWLRDVGRCNAVRLPIGWFTLGPEFCQGTVFQGEVGEVYVNAWKYVKLLVQKCHARGIGTLLDFHALPGGANGDEHSGTDSGKAEFWGSRAYQELAVRCLCFMAKEAKGMEGVVGLQIVNEAQAGVEGMFTWYEAVLKEIGKIDRDLPVYVSDGWNLGKAVEWSVGWNSTKVERCPVVVDTHLYWCFTAEDGMKSTWIILGEVAAKLGELDGKEGGVADQGAVQVIVGEYSCVLADFSWTLGNNTSKEQLVQQFGYAQSKRYQDRAGGSYMWSYRADGEWDFKQMTEQHAILPPPALSLSIGEVQYTIVRARAKAESLKITAYAEHCAYWDRNFPGEYEHWRFDSGYGVGFSDAISFFNGRSERGLQGAERIGMVELWVLKRVREHCGGVRGDSIWEFEHGLRKGIKGFEECVEM